MKEFVLVGQAFVQLAILFRVNSIIEKTDASIKQTLVSIKNLPKLRNSNHLIKSNYFKLHNYLLFSQVLINLFLLYKMDFLIERLDKNNKTFISDLLNALEVYLKDMSLYNNVETSSNLLDTNVVIVSGDAGSSWFYYAMGGVALVTLGCLIWYLSTSSNAPFAPPTISAETAVSDSLPLTVASNQGELINLPEISLNLIPVLNKSDNLENIPSLFSFISSFFTNLAAKKKILIVETFHRVQIVEHIEVFEIIETIDAANNVIDVASVIIN